MWKNILIIGCALIFVVRGGKTPFIFGGKPVTDNAYNFMVYIEYFSNETHADICSGSILNEKWVLTAAHCFESYPNPMNVNLMAGTSTVPLDRSFYAENLQFISSAKNIYIHEGYDFADGMAFDNDIALIELDTPLFLNKNVGTIGYSKERSFSNLNCNVVGFGYTENRSIGVLYQITNNIILPPDECEKAHNYRLNGHFVCLFNKTKGICHGDSGGPLLCGGKIYALSTASTSKISQKDQECLAVTESYFLMIEPYRDWINDRMFPKSISNSNIVAIIVVTVFGCLSLFIIILMVLYYFVFKKNNRTIDIKSMKPKFYSNVRKSDVDDADENMHYFK